MLGNSRDNGMVFLLCASVYELSGQMNWHILHHNLELLKHFKQFFRKLTIDYLEFAPFKDTEHDQICNYNR